MKKTICLVLTLLLATSLFVGCGNSGTDAGDGGDSAKDTLIVALPNEPTQLDPQLIVDTYGSLIALNLHDPLVRRNENGEVVPAIAESWEASEDGMVYTFKLREDVKFQNGSQLTADDVVFTLNRAIELPQSELFTAPFKSAEKVDDYTVKLMLNYPDQGVLQCLTQGNNCIVSKEVIEASGDKYTDEPIGTGPYKLVKWDRGNKLVLEANEDYYLGAAPIKNLELRIIKESTTTLIALETGDVDMVLNLAALDVPTVKANDKLAIQETDSKTIWTLRFNLKMAPLDNKQVRQALYMAINKNDVIEVAADGAGTPATIELTEQTQGYPGEVKGLEYDPVKAKALLAEAGFPDGFKTKICVREDHTKKIGQIIQSNWKEIGVDAEVVVMERSALISDANAGKLPIFTAGDVDCTLDASFLVTSLTTGSFAPDGDNNCFFSNARYDELDKAQQYERDLEKRKELIKEMQEIELDECPRVNLYFPKTNVAYNKDLQGVTVFPAAEGYFWHSISW